MENQVQGFSGAEGKVCHLGARGWFGFPLDRETVGDANAIECPACGNYIMLSSKKWVVFPEAVGRCPHCGKAILVKTKATVARRYWQNIAGFSGHHG